MCDILIKPNIMHSAGPFQEFIRFEIDFTCKGVFSFPKIKIMFFPVL